MVTAFVLISVEDRVPLVLLDSDIVNAPERSDYDLVAVVRVQNNQELGTIITEHIVKAPGVERTKTLFALESHSKFDLADIFLDD